MPSVARSRSWDLRRYVRAGCSDGVPLDREGGPSRHFSGVFFLGPCCRCRRKIYAENRCDLVRCPASVWLRWEGRVLGILVGNLAVWAFLYVCIESALYIPFSSTTLGKPPNIVQLCVTSREQPLNPCLAPWATLMCARERSKTAGGSSCRTLDNEPEFHRFCADRHFVNFDKWRSVYPSVADSNLARCNSRRRRH